MRSGQREQVERRLAAILAADVVGYSRLIEADEEGTLGRLKTLRAEIIDPKIAGHRGRIVKTTGDGLLVEFSSVVDALRCAAELQAAMAERNGPQSPDRRIDFRIGIHQGDVVVEDRDIFGDGVNIAARLEGLAEPGGICISARVHEDAVGRLDLAFDDIGEQALRNISRPVRVFRVRSPLPNPPPLAGEGRVGVLPLPDKPSIAVLPFANMSGDPEQEYFADGMVEEIITALSRIRWLFVIARNSSFTYKGQAVDVKQVGRELGVRYVLEGSVRKAGGRVRITAQLIDAATGAHLWADRFDGPLEDVFELQDRVAISVAGVVEPALRAAEVERARQRPTKDLSAYDLYLRAVGLRSSLTKEGIIKALSLYEQAIAIDRHYGPALAGAAVCHLRLVADGWTDKRKTSRRKAIENARQALYAAESDPGVVATAAFVLAQLGEDIDAMIALVDRALALDPSSARAWFDSGAMRLWAGQLDSAVEHMETALRLSPRERIGVPLVYIGMAHFFSQRFEEAASKFLLDIQDRPYRPRPYQYLAACYAHMGRIDEAREVVVRLRAITPLVIPDELPLRNPEHRELFLSGLRLAAGET
jgi:TolB-like protein/class 3 adenylate cyclase